MVNYTGLAMVHGTKNEPEAFLSSKDTKSMRAMLDAVSVLIKIPKMMGSQVSNFNSSEGVIIEQINVYAETLNSDQDLEDLADRLGQTFAKAMTTKRGMSIGNLTVK